MMELLDFLGELRRGLGPRRLLAVCLVGLGEGGKVTHPTEAEVALWERKLRGTGDASLLVRSWPEGGSEA